MRSIRYPNHAYCTTLLRRRRSTPGTWTLKGGERFDTRETLLAGRPRMVFLHNCSAHMQIEGPAPTGSLSSKPASGRVVIFAPRSFGSESLQLHGRMTYHGFCGVFVSMTNETGQLFTQDDRCYPMAVLVRAWFLTLHPPVQPVLLNTHLLSANLYSSIDDPICRGYQH